MRSGGFSARRGHHAYPAEFFVFPGHTILQADTQIYIPILEHIADPTLLTNDIMAVRPHVSFTLYDEAALILRACHGAFVRARLSRATVRLPRCWRCSGLYLLGDGRGFGSS